MTNLKYMIARELYSKSLNKYTNLQSTIRL